MKSPLLIILYTLFCSIGTAQTDNNIDLALSQLTGQSENIIKNDMVINLLANGKPLLPVLSAKFTDNTTSAVFSKCTGRYLTKGELAIILADHIDSMPYFLLTGMENCMLESCEDNPNFVEYYLNFIKKRGITATVQKRYDEWLKDRRR